MVRRNNDGGEPPDAMRDVHSTIEAFLRGVEAHPEQFDLCCQVDWTDSGYILTAWLEERHHDER